jgi:hypothetical protein
MRYRKLRIAWSVTWGLVALLLIVLWVRSYRWEDALVWVQGSARNVFAVGSMFGRVQLTYEPGGDSEEMLLPPFCRLQRPPARSLKSIPSFALNANANFTSFRFPIWVLVLLAAAIGTTSWLRFSCRFSLRRLLIATTLVAVVLGLAVYTARK